MGNREKKHWLRKCRSELSKLLAENSTKPLLHLRYIKYEWTREIGFLNGAPPPPVKIDEYYQIRKPKPTSLTGMKSAIRRSFDKLYDPNIIAVGLIDAWHAYDHWEMGLSILISGVPKTQLFDNLPVGRVDPEPILDAGKWLSETGRGARRAKDLYELNGVPPERRKEYRSWLSALDEDERIFRYGCDRNANRIHKEPRRPKPLAPRKPYPYPRQLQAFMFNNHPLKCQCRACGGLGK